MIIYHKCIDNLTLWYLYAVNVWFQGKASLLILMLLLLIRLQNDLYCVGWGVKLYSLTPVATDADKQESWCSCVTVLCMCMTDSNSKVACTCHSRYSVIVYCDVVLVCVTVTQIGIISALSILWANWCIIVSQKKCPAWKLSTIVSVDAQYYLSVNIIILEMSRVIVYLFYIQDLLNLESVFLSSKLLTW